MDIGHLLLAVLALATAVFVCWIVVEAGFLFWHWWNRPE